MQTNSSVTEFKSLMSLVLITVLSRQASVKIGGPMRVRIEKQERVRIEEPERVRTRLIRVICDESNGASNK